MGGHGKRADKVAKCFKDSKGSCDRKTDSDGDGEGYGEKKKWASTNEVA